MHRTDQPPEAALLALYTALAGRHGARNEMVAMERETEMAVTARETETVASRP